MAKVNLPQYQVENGERYRESGTAEVLSTCRMRAWSSAKTRTWAAAHEAHVTTFHSANARVRSAR